MGLTLKTLNRMKKQTLQSAKKLKQLLLVAVLLLFSFDGKSTHLVGGEISYQLVAGTTNDYLITLTLYRDCSGIPVSTSPVINFTSGCSAPLQLTLIQVGAVQNITPVCALQSGNTTCNGGSLIGVEKYVFSNTITLTSCNNWEMYYDDCCRNFAITNLVNSGSESFWITASLDNSIAPNNSAAFKFDSQFAIATGVSSNFNWGAVEVDGDSLVYELISARGYNGGAVSYTAPATFSDPFFASVPASLNTATGDFTVSPNQLQLSVVCIKVSEFRGGVMIGSVTRDIQVYVINETNALPSLTGINGTSNSTISGCPGSPITFTINSYDADAGQQLTIIENNPAAGATVSYSTALHPAATFTWVPTIADVSANPYVLTLKVQDDNCDYMGTQFYSYSVFVIGCNQNDVWPGDANADGTANLYDLISIGQAYNDNGPVRTGASVTWLAQPAANWANSFTSGVNHKHADCDGNGTVDANDISAILLNYSQTHPLRVQQPVINTTLPDVFLVANADTVGTSALVDFDIVLGNATLPISSIYGIAFKVSMNSTLIDTTQITAIALPSFVGTPGTDVITLSKIFNTNAQTDFALCRNTQTNTAGYGTIGRIGVVITDNLSGKIALNANISDVYAFKFNGDVVPLNAIGDLVVIDPLLSVSSAAQNNFISVYPNPALDNVYVKFKTDVSAAQINFSTLDGKVVKTVTINSTQNGYEIKTDDMAAGLYFISVKMNDGTTQQAKITIAKK